MENNPLVSIITPTYNRASFLEETINSILNQDYKNIEYIVIDDGSTDNTQELLQKYNNKLISIKQENSGEVLAINRGLSMVSGEIVGIVSSDDFLYPNAVNQVVKFFNENQNIVVAYSDWNRIDENSQIIEKFETHDFDLIDMVRWHENMLCVGSFFKKKILLKLKGRDPKYRYVADFDFWLHAGLEGDLKRIPLILAAYRQHSGAASEKSKGHRLAREHVELIKSFYNIPNLPDELLKAKKEAYSSAYYYAFASEKRKSIFHKIFYITASILYWPHNYFSKDMHKLKSIPFYLFPKPLFILCKYFYRLLKKAKKLFKNYHKKNRINENINSRHNWNARP